MDFLLVLGIFFALLTLLAVSLLKTYRFVPPKELKRRAREGDEVSRILYKAVGYGTSLEVVLWAGIGISAAGFFVISAAVWPAWFALISCALLVWLGFFWVPSGRVTNVGMRVAKTIAPMLSWALNYMHNPINRLVGYVRRHRPVRFHTGLYDKEDLLDLLTFQQSQIDSRVPQEELELARRALIFGDILVRDILTPRRVVRTVSATDTAGPVLMAELHKSGFSRFPVHQEGAESPIIGTLYLRDVTAAKTGGLVAKIMRPEVCFVHEEQPLPEALQAILKTRHHLMVVVNSFEEYVGIVTMEDVLEQIIGKPIVDEFDQYDDMRAVAAKMAAKDHAAHQGDEKESSEPSSK